MNANLTLSKSSVFSRSSWSCTLEGSSGGITVYTYTYPDVIVNGEVSVTVPQSLRDVNFESAAFTYTLVQDQAGGTRTVRFKDTKKAVTNAALLARLKAGDTSFAIQFYYRAAGGTGGPGMHYANCTWKDLKIAVTYTPKSKIHGYATASDGTSIYYGIDADNLAQGEKMPVRLYFTAKQAVTSVSFNILGNHGGNGYRLVSKTASAGGVWDSTFTFTLPTSDPSEWTQRISSSTSIDIVITYKGSDNFVETGYVTTSLKLVRERIAPALSLTFTDTSDVYTDFGVYVQRQSDFSAAASVTLDTGADSGNAVTSLTLTINGNKYGAVNSVFDVGTLPFSGSVPWTLEAKDSYGVTGSISGNLTLAPWAPPSLTSIAPERYSAEVDTGGQTVYYPDDGGVDIRISLAGSVTPVNGLNAWTLVMTAASGQDTYTRTLLTGTDGQAISLTEDRSVFNAQLAANRNWAVTLTLSDSFVSVVYDGIVIPKAGAIFNIEKTGVAVGLRSTGTEDDPLFQVAYRTYLNGPLAIASLVRLNGRAYDTGWVSLTSYAVTSVITPTATRFHIRRIGNIVHLRIRFVLVSALASNTWLNITSAIPTQFRPDAVVRFLCTASPDNGMYLDVQDNGILRTYCRGQSVSANGYLSGDVMYTVPDAN
ncbi:MAG: hypothetical protein K5663_11435 [Clostridiales bacterium]|nr:hypothetical protein [Clostridiales bacterium]